MYFQRVETHPAAVQFNKSLEKVANQLVRGWDNALARAGLGGKKAEYDDARFAFEGRVAALLGTRRIAVRAASMPGAVSPHSIFREGSPEEIKLLSMAE
ncbi:MAG TPA: hypothetical protein VFM46_10615, partial [Pseudomonadales bacterium]|nr:hypothetical protein [Pseudomonadales bacterium]